LVSYYAAADFGPILRKCLRGCLEVLGPAPARDENKIFEHALTLNSERTDHAVWPLAGRLEILFGEPVRDCATRRRLTAAFLEPIFATAIVDPEALATLASLRAGGFATAIVSNTPWGSPSAPWRAELARHNLLSAVDAVVFCVDVGHRKPHRAPFDRALALLEVHAADAVFVGDDPHWDVVGAEQAGIRPLLLTRRRTAALAGGVAGDGDPVSQPATVPVARNLREVLDHVLPASWPTRVPPMA
jgi:FMN phosphatase YigB (HAD superfamily)